MQFIENNYHNSPTLLTIEVELIANLCLHTITVKGRGRLGSARKTGIMRQYTSFLSCLFIKSLLFHLTLRKSSIPVKCPRIFSHKKANQYLADKSCDSSLIKAKREREPRGTETVKNS